MQATLSQRLNLTGIQNLPSERSVSASVQPTRPCLASQTTDRSISGEPGRAELEKLKEQFMVLANHELRTPATIVSAALEMLEQLGGENLSPVQQKFLRQARSGMQRLNSQLDMMNRILACSVPNPDIRYGTFYLANLIKQVSESVEPHLRKRGQRLLFTGEDNEPIQGDLPKLAQALIELISNAAKNSPDGSRIAVQFERSGGSLAMMVIDEAEPIADDEFDKIFDPFYQLGDLSKHHSSKFDYQGGGPGLGLCFCQKVAQAHGGSIRGQHNQAGRGNTFVFTLPVVKLLPMRPNRASRLLPALDYLSLIEKNREGRVSLKSETLQADHENVYK